MKAILLLVFITLASLTAKSQDLEKVINITDSISLSMVQKTFEPDSHAIIYNDNELVLLIDDYLVYGTDATMPETYLSKAELIINGKGYCLNTKGMYDPNLKVLNSEMVSVTQNYSGYTIRMLLSVGAGYYGVEWLIMSDKSYRTILTNDWKILDDGFVPKESFFDEEIPATPAAADLQSVASSLEENILPMEQGCDESLYFKRPLGLETWEASASK